MHTAVANDDNDEMLLSYDWDALLTCNASCDPTLLQTSHWFESHGDYHMDKIDGYHLRLPDNLCVVHDGSPLRVQAHVNDVRFASLHGNAGMGAASTVKLIAIEAMECNPHMHSPS